MTTAPPPKIPPINLWTYRQALAIALWLALSDLSEALNHGNR